LAKTPTAVSASYDRRIGRVVIELSSGLAIAFKRYEAQGMQGATPEDLAGIETSPSDLFCIFPSSMQICTFHYRLKVFGAFLVGL